MSATAHHVDAPEISVEDVTTTLGGLSLLGGEAGGALSSDDDQWADTQGGALEGWGSKKKGSGANNNSASLVGATGAAGADSKVTELLDMQALNAKRNVQDDVAERLRIEETKAALARAKEGMAKEAERLAADKAEKEAQAAARSDGGGASGGSALGGAIGGGGGGKWVPSFRSTGSSSSGVGSNIRGPASMGGGVGIGAGMGFQKSVDLSSEELFPDLAVADQILAEKEKQLKAEQDRMASTPQSTGWGSGLKMMGSATSASTSSSSSSPQRKPLVLTKPSAERKPLNLAPPSKKQEEVVAVEIADVDATNKGEKLTVDTEPTAPVSQLEGTTSSTAESTELAPENIAAITAVAAAPAITTTSAPEKAAPTPVLKKKKKKDLSTFKVKS